MSKMHSVVQSNATTFAGIVERVAVDPDDLKGIGFRDWDICDKVYTRLGASM